MKKVILAVFLAAMPALAGPLEVGFKAGVPLTDFLSAARSPNFGFNSQTKRYILGTSVQLNLPAGFALELDLLYRRMSYEAVDGTSQVTANAWEFPLLVKYRFGAGPVRPFVAAGAAWDKLSGLGRSVAELRNSRIAGFVAGGGIDLKAVAVHITPEIRYTQWGAQHFRDVTSGLLHSNQGQAEFLLGISF
jgi:hypothetical protein